MATRRMTPSYNRRTSVGSFEWGGMMPDGSPGSLPPNRPRALFNTRIQAGSYVPRPGQTKLVEGIGYGRGGGGIDEKVRYLEDFPIIRHSLTVVGAGCPRITATGGFFVGSFDQEQSPALQANVYYSSASGALRAAKFGNDLYISRDKELRKFQPIDAPFDLSNTFAGGTSQDIILFEAPSAYTIINLITEFDGALFAAYDGRVVVWDGVTETTDITGLTGTPTGWGIYRDQLVMGYNGTPNEIRVRPMGAAPGTWATITPSAGTAKALRGVSYKDAFYFTTNDDYLMRLSGVTLDPIVAATIGFAAGADTKGICVFNGFLYVAYVTALGLIRIAKFDGTTWTAIEKDISAQFLMANFALPLVEYRGSLALGGKDSVNGSTIWTSDGTDTDGTWVANNVGNVLSGNIIELVNP